MPRYQTDSGRPVLGVTETLTLTGEIDRRFYNEEGARLGQLLHTVTAALDRDEPWPDDADEVMSELEQYQTFLGVVRPRYVGIEEVQVDDFIGLGGRVDRRCSDLLGLPAIVDLKRGAPEPWHALQTWGYWYLAGADPQMRRFALYLPPEGKYKLIPHTSALDGHRFLDLHRQASRLTL